MRSSVRWLLIVGSVIAVVVLFVLLRPDASENGATPTPSTPSGSPSSSDTPSPSDSPSPTPSPTPERTVIDVTFRNGSVRGPTEFTVTQGQRVRIVVRADISDHVHLHSYDLMADVAPGRPARIEFVADVAGVFECELEDVGRLLFHLEIVP